MSLIQGVRVLVEQFLSATADQIVEAVEKMVSGYEEEMLQSKREISGQRKMLDALLQPEIRLNSISDEAQLNLSVGEEDLLTEQQQEWDSCEVSVKHFLSVAAERIMKAVEKMILGYKGEMLQSKREIRRQCRMINACLQPQIRLTRIPDGNNQIEQPLPFNSAEQMPIEADEQVASPGFSESENQDDDDWNAQDRDSDNSEELSPTSSKKYCIATAKTPKTKKPFMQSFICKICEKSFRYEGSFLKHLGSHPKDECGLCGMHFDTEEDFELHLKTHVKAKNVCDVCGKYFDCYNYLEKHRRIHTGKKPFKCSECGKSFRFRQSMARHLRVHTGERPFACNSCNKMFSDYTTLKRHVQAIHKTVIVTPSTLDDGDGTANIKDSTAQNSMDQMSSTICKVCGKDFHKMMPLLKHAKTHTEGVCGICATHCGSQESLKFHLQTHKDEITQASIDQMSSTTCKVCGKDFVKMMALVNHAKTHTKGICGVCATHWDSQESLKLHLQTHKDEIAAARNEKAVCDVCGKCFSRHTNLEDHVKTHTAEKLFTCEVCGRSFSMEYYLTKHLTIHSGERPYRCELCGKSFRLQYHLTRHHIHHTGEKPYECTICSKQFIRYSTLRKHIQQHKRRTTTRTAAHDRDEDAEVVTELQLFRVICKVCGVDFHSKVSLVNHLESHPKDDCGLCGMYFNTELEFEHHLETHKDEIAKVCDVCGKCFSKPLYLEKHMSTHMGEKPFKCSVCDKAFRLRMALTDHIRTHTGEKPYSCPTCSKCFKTKSNLRQHMKRCRRMV